MRQSAAGDRRALGANRATWVGEPVMEETGKSRSDLLAELKELRSRIVELEELRSRIVELELERAGPGPQELAPPDRREQSRHGPADPDHLYRTAPVGLCVVDTDLRFVRVNERLAAINGRQVSEHVGRTLKEVVPDIAPKMEPICRRVLESGQPLHDVEIQGVTPARPDRKITALVSSYPVKSPDGMVEGVSSVVRDITEHKRAQDALRMAHDGLERRVQQRTAELRLANKSMRREMTERNRAEQALRAREREKSALLRAVPDLMFRISRDGTFLDFVPAKDLDPLVPPEKFLGMRLPEVLPAEVARRCMDGVVRTLETGELQTIEYRLTVDAETRDYESRIVVCGEDEVVAIVRDITERKQAGERLLFQAQLLDSVRESLVATDLDGCVTYWGKGAEVLYGYAAEEVLGKSVMFIVRPEEEHEERARMHQALDTGSWKGQYRQQCKDGSSFWADTVLSLVTDRAGKPCGFIGIDRDITERNRGQEQLRLQAQLLDSVRESLVATDLEGRVTYWGKAAESLYGYAPEEILGKSIMFLVKPEEELEERERMHQALETGSWKGQYRQQRKDGSAFWADTVLSLVTDRTGKPCGFIGIDRDITQAKQAEEALQESYNLFQAVVEGTSDAVFVKDLDGRYLVINSTGAAMLGRRPEEVVGKDDTELFGEADARRIMETDRQIMTTGVPHTLEETIDFRGKSATLFTSKAAYRDDQGRIIGLTGISRDITERKQAEENARQLEGDLVHVGRVSMLGEMAAALAHELNQPLTAIANYTEGCLGMLHSGDANPEELRDAMDRVAKLTHRTATIIQRIRRLVRKSDPHRSSVNMNDLVREVAALIDSETRIRRVTLRLELAEALPIVLADSIQIQQVLLNLVHNGLDAITDAEDGPRELTIRTSRQDSAGVEVTVSDTGAGLSDEDAQQMFEPFFSTKPGGIGMGLTISRSIINAHGGRLWAESNPDRGAAVRFSLPVGRGEPDDEG
ncbi:MAG: PAS domain S-box protein [Planctomycetota bacterium]